jgi:hypothetical protein
VGQTESARDRSRGTGTRAGRDRLRARASRPRTAGPGPRAPRSPLTAHLSRAWGQRLAPALPASGSSPAARAARPLPAATRSDARRGSLNPRRHASCHHITANRHQERGEEGRAGEGGEQSHAAPCLPKGAETGPRPRWSPRGDLPRLHKAPQFGQEGREPATK